MSLTFQLFFVFFSEEMDTDDDLSLVDRLVLGLRRKLDSEGRSIFSKGIRYPFKCFFAH